MQFSQALNSRRVARSLVTILALTLVQTIAAPIIAPHLTTQKSEAVTVDYASATAGTDVVVPAGATSVQLTARGGAGGSGGNDGGALGTAGSRVGYVSGTFNVTPGDRITLYPGGAGSAGASSLSSAAGGTAGATSINTNGNTLTPAAKMNGTYNLSLFINGGAGGAAGNGGSSGGGGGGGAGSAIFINDSVVLVAGGGGGGGGGSGANATAWDEVPASNGTSAIGGTGLVGTCTGQTDGGGSGGGGGGWYGGAAGAVTRPGGTTGECRGYGGAAGSNFVDTTYSPTSTTNGLTPANGAGSVTYVFNFDSVSTCVAAQQVVDIYTVVRINTTSPCIWTVPSGVSVIDLFLVGGGGGGAGDGGAGGNGGAALSRSAIAVTPSTNLSVKVGYGGAGSTWAFPSSAYAGDSTTVVTSSGTLFYALGGATGGNGPGQAAGAVATPQAGAFAGGQGGTSAAGSPNSTGGVGKRGVTNYFYGSQNTYAGGGGGGIYTNTSTGAMAGAAAYDGGGAGATENALGVNFPGSNGTANSGGGGGGGVAVGTGYRVSGGKGGSGVVLIRYATSAADAFPASLTSALAARWNPNDLQLLDSGRKGWIDSSGTNTSVTDGNFVGTPSLAYLGATDGGVSTGSTKTFLTAGGGTGDRVTLKDLPSGYTLFHITKYVSGGSNRRIMTTNTGNWLSGHFDGGIECTHHNWWLAGCSNTTNIYSWLLSSDQNRTYRGNGKDLTYNNDAHDGNNVYNTYSQSLSSGFGINNTNYSGQNSNWKSADILVFNRELSGGEMHAMEVYLARIYGLTLNVDAISSETDTAITFDGNQYYYTQYGYNNKLNDLFTVESWVNLDASCGVGGNHTCSTFNRENQLVMAITGGTLWYALYGTNSAWAYLDTGLKIPTGEWHHIAILKDKAACVNGSLKVYLDGNLAYVQANSPYRGTALACGGATDVVYPEDTWTYIGSRQGIYDRYYGQLDEVKVWKVARTAAEIKSDMYSTDPTSSNLQMYYDFNKSTPTTYGNVPNLGYGGLTRADLIAVTGNNMTYSDVKIVLTPVNSPYTTITFPRTYLTQYGGWKVPSGISQVQTVVVGGGGGGGGGYQGGGGGAGGLIETITTLNSGTIYPVRVGTGGNGHGNVNPATSTPGTTYTAMPTNGETSTAFGLTASGGGFGSSEFDSTTAGSSINVNRQPSSGGSGGGGGWVNGNSTTGAQGIAGQGNAGGNGGNCCTAAGGGGAGSVGANGTTVKGGDGGAGFFSNVLQKNLAAGGGGSVRLDATTSAQGSGGSGVGGSSGYKPNAAVGATGGATNGSSGTGSGGGAGLSLMGTYASYSGAGGSGIVALKFITATVPVYTKPTNAYLNVGMTETFTTNVAIDSQTVGLTRTFKWESTTAGTAGLFTTIKAGTGATNAAFSWIPSDTSTSGPNYLYRLTVTDSDTAGLVVSDSSTAYAVINQALVVTSTASSNYLAKKINLARNETFTITLGTPTYKAVLSPVISGITIDTSTAGSVILKIADTASVGTWLETLTVTDSVSAKVVFPLTISVAAPPNLLSTGEIVTNGLVFNLDAGNSASILGESGTATTGLVWRDLSGRKADATTSKPGTTVTTGAYSNSACTAPKYTSDAGGAIVFETNSDNCYYSPYTGADLNKSYTVEAWFKTSASIPGWAAIVSNSYPNGSQPISVTIGSLGGSDLYVSFYDGANWRYANCGHTPTIGVWTHISGTYDGQKMVTYINGIKLCDVAYTGGFNSNINPYGMIIGKSHSGASAQAFPGSVASVRIYNVPLTADQILANFNATKYRFKDAPVTLLNPSRKYGLVTVESFTPTSGSETKTVSLTTGNLAGLTWDQTSIPGQLKVTASETFSVGTYFDTITVTDSLGQSTYLPIKFTISKADTLTVSMSSATTNVYTSSTPVSVPKPTISGLVGLDTATVLSRFDTATVGKTCATGGTCVVGDTGPGGGVVFYVSDTPIDAAAGVSDGGIYLEMYTTTLNVNNWATDPTSVSGTQSAVGTGAENSRLAFTQLGTNSALMNTIVNGTYGGKSDWFVPSLDEATTMVSVLRGLGLGSFGNQNLWTSTQGTDASTAQNVWSSNPPVVSALTKSGGYSVRPIRAFGGTTITPVDVDTYTVQGTNLTFSVGALSNYYNIVYETSTLKITQANQNKLSLNLYGAVAGSPFTLITSGGSGSGAISETITAGSSATNCQVSNHVLSNSNSAKEQKFCRVTITKASSRNYKSESLTADVYFMVFVNDQPTNQVGGGTVIALSGKTSLTIETSTVSIGGSNFGAPLLAGYPAHYDMTCFGSPGGVFCTPEHWIITGQGFGSMYNTNIVVKFYRNAVVTLSNQTEVANSGGNLVNYVFSDTQIMIETFPVGARSGMIVVETPFGVAISDYDFEIP